MVQKKSNLEYLEMQIRNLKFGNHLFVENLYNYGNRIF